MLSCVTAALVGSSLVYPGSSTREAPRGWGGGGIGTMRTIEAQKQARRVTDTIMGCAGDFVGCLTNVFYWVIVICEHIQNGTLRRFNFLVSTNRKIYAFQNDLLFYILLDTNERKWNNLKLNHVTDIDDVDMIDTNRSVPKRPSDLIYSTVMTLLRWQYQQFHLKPRLFPSQPSRRVSVFCWRTAPRRERAL